MRPLLYAVTYYLLGVTVGIFVGAYWPPAHPLEKTQCQSPLTILEQSIPRVQTPHLRTTAVLVR